MDSQNLGLKLHNFAKRLWPINRSLSGEGNRKTLFILKDIIPQISIYEVPTGTKVFDWEVPLEWHVNDAYIITPEGKKICNFQENNLHLMGYSIPIKKKITLDELQGHLYSLPSQPSAIPYVTSYYEKRWGFCLSENLRKNLRDGYYEVFIDSKFYKGSLTYGELLIKGDSNKEIFFSTYICHPSMANNELSGIVVLSHIANWLSNKKSNRFSYRFVFVPETIGSIAYLSKNIKRLKSKVFAGYSITCIGDNRDYSYLPSRNGNTISDIVAKHVLKNIHPTYKNYKWIDRGSDERQYCSPGVDLPIASVMRTKYGMYEEYHTSLDDLINVVTPAGLEGGFNLIKKIVEALENNRYPKVKFLCEPQLSKHGLYPTISNLSSKDSQEEIILLLNFISYSDGSKSLIEIAELCECPVWKLYPILEKLIEKNLITLSDK